MKTILLSIVGFITSLFFAYRKGSGDKDAQNEIQNYKRTINSLKNEKSARDIIDSLSDSDIRKL